MRKEQFGRAGDEDETGQTRFFFLTCTLSSSKKVAEQRDTL